MCLLFNIIFVFFLVFIKNDVTEKYENAPNPATKTYSAMIFYLEFLDLRF